MTDPTADRDRLVEQIAAEFHRRYEQLAPAHGWESRTKDVPFGELPEANRRLMTETVGALLDDGVIEAGARLSAGFQSVAERWGAIHAAP